MILRLVLGIVILSIVFSLGVMVGEIKSFTGDWNEGSRMMRGYDSGYGYPAMPMMRGYYYSTQPQQAAPVAPTPAK